ncbi:hypothetical protein NITLEN_20046 [Nitrospira lenta]|uniref:Uncharacterized protein n=1 Tax=Nitrospira lenta TaxID=1436998 RepID=A0A330L3Y1_9BACT|nr:hypothetical protein NITLEN_20046 [Nitrospira lenta]
MATRGGSVFLDPVCAVTIVIENATEITEEFKQRTQHAFPQSS